MKCPFFLLSPKFFNLTDYLKFRNICEQAPETLEVDHYSCSSMDTLYIVGYKDSDL